MMMQRKNVLAALTLLSVGTANACYTVKVQGPMSSGMTVIWKAQGCAGICNGCDYVCHHATVGEGYTASYDYNWGTTAPTVVVQDNGGTYNHKCCDHGDWSDDGKCDGAPSCETTQINVPDVTSAAEEGNQDEVHVRPHDHHKLHSNFTAGHGHKKRRHVRRGQRHHHDNRRRHHEN